MCSYPSMDLLSCLSYLLTLQTHISFSLFYLCFIHLKATPHDRLHNEDLRSHLLLISCVVWPYWKRSLHRGAM